MADSEEDDVYYSEEHVSPDQGPGLEEEEEGTVRNSHIVSSLSSFIEIIVGLLIYGYVLLSFATNLIIPASFTPLVMYQYYNNTTTNVNQLMEDIGFNGLLMFIFVLQHSFTSRLSVIDNILSRLNMSSCSRALYTLTTCITIHVIRWLWRPIPLLLWRCPDDSTLFFVVMGTVHILGWYFIAFSVFTVDYLELLGLKQLYYHYKGLESPLLCKSAGQRELYNNMRHPLLLCPLVILWAVPVMTYDRFLLAVMIPLYLIWASKLNHNNSFYVREKFNEKKESLKYK